MPTRKSHLGPAAGRRRHFCERRRCCMAEDQGGQGKSLFQSAPWLKLFGAFKIALDPKKLLLAGAGILSMALGWWFLAVFFGLFRANPPQWSSYQTENQTDDQMKKAWEAFKHDRQNWNLFHALAGPAPASLKDARRQDAADLAKSLDEYKKIVQLGQDLESYYVPVEATKDALVIE